MIRSWEPNPSNPCELTRDDPQAFLAGGPIDEIFGTLQLEVDFWLNSQRSSLPSRPTGRLEKRAGSQHKKDARTVASRDAHFVDTVLIR